MEGKDGNETILVGDSSGGSIAEGEGEVFRESKGCGDDGEDVGGYMLQYQFGGTWWHGET